MVKMGIDGMFIPFFDFQNTEGYILGLLMSVIPGLTRNPATF